MQDGRFNCFDSAYGLALSVRLLGIPLSAIEHRPFKTNTANFLLHCYTCFQNRVVFDACSAIPEDVALGLLKDVYLSTCLIERGVLESILEIHNHEIH